MQKLLNKKLFAILYFLFSSILYADQSIMEVVPLQNRPASELHPLITPLLENSDRIIANNNSLIVKTTTKRLPAILNLIKKLDIALSNLEIFVHQSKTLTARDLNDSAGISINLPINRQAKARSYLNGHFGSTEKLSDSNNRQIIKTLEGKTAYIKAGKIFPVQDIHIYGIGSEFPSVSTNTRLIEATTGFTVMARLTDQHVILEISPWSENLEQNGIIETQSANTSIRVKLGEWVEIGSINENRQQQQTGFLKHNRSTQKNGTRILLKVEKSND